jgi:hydroxylysine kinase
LTSREAVTGFDGSGDPFLDLTRLTPSAAIAEAQAADGVRAAFGLSGELERLPGEADHNFLLKTTAGRRYMVKFAHLRVDPRVVDVQARVLRHIESSTPELPVPRVVPTVSGKPWAIVADGPLRGRVVHVTTYLDGQLLSSVRTSPALRHRLGVTLASLGRALREFDDPLVRRPLLWDIAEMPRLRPLIAELPRAVGTSLLDEQIGRFTASVAPRLATQRTQLVHNDFSPDNVLISADLSRVCGIIDFGDIAVTALVNDIAIAAAYQLSDQADLLGPAVDVISGYHATTPLSASEIDLLPELILARVVARIVISEWRAARFPENRVYIMRNTPRAWEHLKRLLAIPADEIAARICGACRPKVTDA